MSVFAAMVRTARRLIVALVLVGAIWVAGLVWFAESIPRPGGAPVPDTRTDAVVVLTGGPLRLRTGLTLLEEGKARKLFVSGVNPRVEMAELLRTAEKTTSQADCCIVLGYAADNTTGNANETRGWMEREGYRSLRLVTASYHMRRSLLEFRRAMPGITVVAHPVFPDSFMADSWWSWPGTLTLIVSEYHKTLAAWLRDLMIHFGNGPAA